MARCLPALLLSIALAATSARGEVQPDPPGTIPIKLAVGQGASLGAPPLAWHICDDPAVVHSEMTEGALRLTGVAPGSTLCALRDPSGQIRGMWRVRVVASRSKPARQRPPADANAPDAGLGGANDAGPAGAK